MLPESDFLATLSFMFHFKNLYQPIRTTHPAVPVLVSDALIPPTVT